MDAEPPVHTSSSISVLQNLNRKDVVRSIRKPLASCRWPLGVVVVAACVANAFPIITNFPSRGPFCKILTFCPSDILSARRTARLIKLRGSDCPTARLIKFLRGLSCRGPEGLPDLLLV